MNKRRARVALVAVMMTGLLAAVPARAGECVLSGKLGEFRVGTFTLSNPVELGTFWFEAFDGQQVIVDDESYHVGMAGFVLNATTGEIPTWIATYGSTDVPRVVIEAGGVRHMDQAVPAPTYGLGTQGGQRGQLSYLLPAGTYYVVGFGFGPKGGVVSDSRWAMAANYGYSCPLIGAPGEILTFNQTDFTGGTQVYTPAVGYGSGLSLDFDVARSNVFGSYYAFRDFFGAGDVNFSLSTPTDDTGEQYMGPVVSTGGHYSATLSYAATFPNVDINVLAVDLPLVGDLP